jgi:mono/diheme cytochrome c family protein
MRSLTAWACVVLACGAGCSVPIRGVETTPAGQAQKLPEPSFDSKVERSSASLLSDGRNIFRFETFGSEDFWGAQLQLHRAIVTQRYGGIGPGLSPRQALQLGLKVDVGAVPKVLVEVLKGGAVSLDNPDTTVELLRANAVIGVTGFFNSDGRMTSIGIQCAICHSTVDDSLATGIGRRLDGWPNRDLDIGAIIASAPNLRPLANYMGISESKLHQVLTSWGPGKYDAEVNEDGKAGRPDGRAGATLIPAAFGLAGQNLHTYTGWGSVPYWNAYVAITQMHGQGNFFDPRLDDRAKFPIAARAGVGHLHSPVDRVTDKLAALHYYQLSIPTPEPPAGSFDQAAAGRGAVLFKGKAGCASCHMPPLFSEPGWAMHTASEIGVDDFQAARSPDRRYRTTPLRGLFARSKGGFYHDGRFSDVAAVVEHYDTTKHLDLTTPEKEDLVEYLKSL